MRQVSFTTTTFNIIYKRVHEGMGSFWSWIALLKKNILPNLDLWLVICRFIVRNLLLVNSKETTPFFSRQGLSNNNIEKTHQVFRMFRPCKKTSDFSPEKSPKTPNGRAPEASMKPPLNQVFDPNVPRNVKAFGHITPSSVLQPPRWGFNQSRMVN